MSKQEIVEWRSMVESEDYNEWLTELELQSDDYYEQD